MSLNKILLIVLAVLAIASAMTMTYSKKDTIKKTESSKTKIAMTTIEERTKDFAENAYEFGKRDFLKLPLIERLTEEEKIQIKHICNSLCLEEKVIIDTVEKEELKDSKLQFEVGELVMMRQEDYDRWYPKFFAKYNSESIVPYSAISEVTHYKQCAKFDKDIVFTKKQVLWK